MRRRAAARSSAPTHAAGIAEQQPDILHCTQGQGEGVAVGWGRLRTSSLPIALDRCLQRVVGLTRAGAAATLRPKSPRTGRPQDVAPVARHCVGELCTASREPPKARWGRLRSMRQRCRQPHMPAAARLDCSRCAQRQSAMHTVHS